MSAYHPELDALIWGAKRIGKAAKVVDETGNVALSRTYYYLETGLIPATKPKTKEGKDGRVWVSTLRKILSVAAPPSAENQEVPELPA
jgi:hypothetical protein